jgi:hypothetical protein
MRHHGTLLINPIQTSSANPSANATAHASSEIPRPAAFLATSVVSTLSDTMEPPFESCDWSNFDVVRGARKKKKPAHRGYTDDRASYSESLIIGKFGPHPDTDCSPCNNTARNSVYTWCGISCAAIYAQ